MTNNLFTDLRPYLPDELLTTLLDAANVRIERIVSHGHASPDGFVYDQDQHEWVGMLKGAARLRFENGEMEMQPGDSVNIPAHKKHRVEWTTAAYECCGPDRHHDRARLQADYSSDGLK